jgi:hypothetical protein
MNITLGAKKDVYTGSRCMASGILIGRMAAALTSAERNMANKKDWQIRSAIGSQVESAYKAAKKIEKLQTTARPQIKTFMAKLERYQGGLTFRNEGVAADIAAARNDLTKIAQIVVKTCGKRRPVEGEGAALMEMKNIKREKAPPKDIPMQLPDLEDLSTLAPEEQPAQAPEKAILQGSYSYEQESSSSAWPVLTGVLLLIGAAFLVR